MARSVGDFRGVYSEIESGRHCLTTPSHSLIKTRTDPHDTNPESHIKSSYTIHEPPSDENASAVPSSIHQGHGQGDKDIELQIDKPSTLETLRGCVGNWICLLIGLSVLAGSIAMTIFGFLADEFSHTVTIIGNTTTREKNEAMYESLSNLKTYGPILTGCGCFIIMCACVLLCDARDKLKAALKVDEPIKETDVLTYSDVLRRIYEDEIRRKDEEETQRRTQKIDEYFECMSRHPVGRRTLIRAMRPRSLSDPCIGGARLGSLLPDAYEYARESLETSPIRRLDDTNKFGSSSNDSHQPFDGSKLKPIPTTPMGLSEMTTSGQLLYIERTKPGPLPPLKARSKNGPIRLDTSSLPVGSLERLYLGDENIIGGTRRKQKKKRDKGKRRDGCEETNKSDESAAVLTLPDTGSKNNTGAKSCKLKVTHEVQKSIPRDQPKKASSEKQHEYGHYGDQNRGLAPDAADSKLGGKYGAEPSVAGDVDPSIRTLKWVAENNEQPWNRGHVTPDQKNRLLGQTAGSKSSMCKSSTGSFDGSNTFSLSNQAMVL